MQQLSFKNRIAFNYLISTALMVLFVFIVIYSIVSFSVYSHIDTDIALEVQNHLNEIEIKNNTINLIDADEWKEREHNTIDVNPVFVQFINESGNVIDKSPNLKKLTLTFHSKVANNELFDTKLSGNAIRQIQVPLYKETKIIGYLIIAVSLEDASMVLLNLAEVLIIAYPLILIALFLIARFFAGRSIRPINSIIKTSNIITKDNLKTRIPLPQNRDELYTLTQTINNLLNRVETAIEREKQFTSDASHELRTPLTVIKGTLEVLVRKPRTQEEYKDKINFCVTEVNRLNHLVDQLLLLSRFENQNQSLKMEKVYLNGVILDTVSRYANTIQSKNILVSTEFTKDYYVDSDLYLFSIVINNLVSNALKYSNKNTKLVISITDVANKIECRITDAGIGIPQEDLQRIFDQFYRSRSSVHPDIKGTGLGLSIVKRLCDLLNIDIKINSQEHSGTTVILSFN